jgi:hypothetical protein
MARHWIQVPKLHDVYVKDSFGRDPQLLQKSPVVRVEGEPRDDLVTPDVNSLWDETLRM